MCDASHHHGGWERVSKSKPCEICGKPDNCERLLKPDGTLLVYCGRVQGDLKQNAGGQWLHAIPGRGTAPFQRSHTASGQKKPVEQPKAEPPKDWEAVRADFTTYRHPFLKWVADREVKRLASAFSIDVSPLQRLGVAWGGSCWIIPERDAAGTIIGLSKRFTGGGKGFVAGGGNRGLTYADDWDSGIGPILILEGMSDVAVALELGMNAIGKPGNLSGFDLLADLLKDIPHDRPIIAVGEYDTRTVNGVTRTPGKDGAVGTAISLAKSLGRPIQFATRPPNMAKDLREWHQEIGGTGEEFLSRLELHTITPDDADDTCYFCECSIHKCKCVVDVAVEQALADYHAGRFKPCGHVESYNCRCNPLNHHPSDCGCAVCELMDSEQITRERLLEDHGCNKRIMLWKPGQDPFVISARCNSWQCPSCRKGIIGMRKAHTVKVIKQQTRDQNRLYVAEVDAKDARRFRDRINKLDWRKQGYLRITTRDEKTVFITTVNFPGSSPLDQEEALKFNKDLFEKLQTHWIRKKRGCNLGGKSVVSTGIWKLPKEEKKGYKAIKGNWSSKIAIEKACKEMAITMDGFKDDSAFSDGGIWGTLRLSQGGPLVREWDEEFLKALAARVEEIMEWEEPTEFGSAEEFNEYRNSFYSKTDGAYRVTDDVAREGPDGEIWLNLSAA